MNFNEILNKYKDSDNENGEQMRLKYIARKVAQQFLAEVRKGAYAYKKGTRSKSVGRKASFSDEFKNAFSGAIPTVTDLCNLARQHNFLLLFRIESEQHIVQIRIDPLRRTARQISRTVDECCSWMRLDAANETGDWDDDENKEDENPVPGHEEEEDDNEATDGGWGDDGEGNDDDDEPNNDDNKDEDGDGDSDDDYEDDDEDDDDDDDDEDDASDSADDAWALQRLIESADRANLILSIYPTRRPTHAKIPREKVTLTTIRPPRNSSALMLRFPWWSKSPQPVIPASWQRTTSPMTQLHLWTTLYSKYCLRKRAERRLEAQKKEREQQQKQEQKQERHPEQI